MPESASISLMMLTFPLGDFGDLGLLGEGARATLAEAALTSLSSTPDNADMLCLIFNLLANRAWKSASVYWPSERMPNSAAEPTLGLGFIVWKDHTCTCEASRSKVVHDLKLSHQEITVTSRYAALNK